MEKGMSGKINHQYDYGKSIYIILGPIW